MPDLLTEEELRLLRDEETSSKEAIRITLEESEKDGSSITERALRAQFELLVSGIHIVERYRPSLGGDARNILHEALAASAELICRVEDIHIMKESFAKFLAEEVAQQESPPLN